MQVGAGVFVVVDWISAHCCDGRHGAAATGLGERLR
jgi:hypothetical protein